MTDVDARLARVDAVIKQAIAMDATTFGPKKDDLAQQVMEQMRERSTAGPPPCVNSARTGAGKHNRRSLSKVSFRVGKRF